MKKNTIFVPYLNVLVCLSNLREMVSALLSKKFKKSIFANSLPAWFTARNLAEAAKFNLYPIFLPDEAIAEEADLGRWIKPERRFYEQIYNNTYRSDVGKIKAEITMKLLKGWYLADFSVGADYNKGKQIFPNDKLAPIIARLAQEEKIVNLEDPLGSRFIMPCYDQWMVVIKTLIEDELKIKGYKCGRLERGIEFNAIGNIYDPNRGKFEMFEMFGDHYLDCDLTHARLSCGGNRKYGGLKNLYYPHALLLRGEIAGRPLICF